MDLRLLYALILTIMPVSELRLGMPLAIIYAKDVGISVWPIFLLVILFNILIIFFVFYFLNELHCIFTNFKFYRKFSKKYLSRFQRKVDNFEIHHERIGFLALVLFVSIPLPGTGVWSGSIISWALGLDRKKSILSMALGVLISGTIIFLGTLGVIGFLS